MDNEIVVQGTSNLMTNAASIDNVMGRVKLIHSVMEKVMQRDTHYGVVPGTSKPTLLKPGAEVLATTFQLAPTVTVETERTSDHIRVSAKVGLTSVSGQFVGEGVGECSTGEDKYMWRSAVCDEEWNSFPEDRRRIAYKRGKSGAFTIKQVRQNPDDLANTILKMAKKRAFVDAILTVTGASDIFTQDVEDMDVPAREEQPKEPIVAKENADIDVSDVMPDATTKDLIAAMYKAAKDNGKTTGWVHEAFSSLWGVDKYTELSDEQLRKMIVILGK